MGVQQIPVVRILQAIRRIGYTPVSALLDIIDNSIVAGAKEISVNIKAQKENISEIIIYDNGSGMNKDQVINALILGSPDSEYSDNSLSKYGFGLKSAGLSQADRIEVISRKFEKDIWYKAALDWNEISDKNDYYISEDLSLIESDKDLVEKIKKGTIIRLTKVLQVNDSSIQSFIKTLKAECGLTFHRFIENENINIYIDNEKVKAYDPLFLSEAKNSIAHYSGEVPCYFLKDEKLPLNPKTGNKMSVSCVQLPYPPMFNKEGRQNEINNKYNMKLKNIGFYIYRNNRLILKSERWDLVSYDQEYMAFRARIDLDSSADSFVNLDVSKSKVIFPDYAFSAIKERFTPIIKRSKELWNAIKAKQADPTIGQSDIVHEASNKELSGFSAFIANPEAGEMQDMSEAIAKEAKKINELWGIKLELLEELKAKKDRIISVDQLKNSMLWKPYIDPENSCKVAVMLSREHPFYKHIYNKLTPGDSAIIILDALFLNLAMAEASILATDVETIKTFKLLRQSTSMQLANFIDLKIEED